MLGPAQLALLKTELVSDPLARGYAGMSNDGLRADRINVADRSGVFRNYVETHEIISCINLSEYIAAAITNPERSYLDLVMKLPQVPVKGNIATQLLLLFTAGESPITRAALVDVSKKTGSRAEELLIVPEFGLVTASDVADAYRS